MVSVASLLCLAIVVSTEEQKSTKPETAEQRVPPEFEDAGKYPEGDDEDKNF